MSEEEAPLGTTFTTCSTCKGESDHICPICHPECDTAFKSLEESGEAVAPANPITQDFPLINDLDHIQVRLLGPWPPEALKAMMDGFQAAAEAAKEDGLRMEFVAIRRRPIKAFRAEVKEIIGADGKLLPFKSHETRH